MNKMIEAQHIYLDCLKNEKTVKQLSANAKDNKEEIDSLLLK